MYAVILAGGGGTRLRPLSRDERPKPFLPLLGERTLIQQTVDRLHHWLAPKDIHVVTDQRYAELVRRQIPGIGRIVEEPQGRNTAAAIALAALTIDMPDDSVMIVLPADHSIVHEGLFIQVLESASRHLARGAFDIEDPLVTLGIQMNRAATEYGYLIPNIDRGDVIDGLQTYPLAGFREKPTRSDAEGLYTAGGGTAWNAGMFLWRRRAIRHALETYTDLPMAGESALRAAYPTITGTSIDYAVMEPAARDGRVVMASMDVGWSDIGGWSALLEAIGARGTGRVVQPGEPADLDAGDLAIVRGPTGLAISVGPGTIRSDGPVALLSDAAADRDRIEQLLARVAAKEAQEP